MAWVTKRKSASGSIRHQGRYRDPHGEKQTAGTFSTSREALKAAMKAAGKVADGT